MANTSTVTYRPSARAAGHRWSYTVLCLAVALPVYSFFPVTPKPDSVSDVWNSSRLTEFALLLGSAYVLTSTTILRRHPIAMRGHGLTVCLLYIAWALCSTLWSRNPIYTFGKSLEFLLLAYIAAFAIVNFRGLPKTPRHGIEGLITYAGLIVIGLSLASNALLWDTPFHFHQNEGRTRLSFGYSYSLETADFCAVTAIVAFASPLAWPLRIAVAALGTWIVYLADARSTLIFLVAVLCVAAVMRIRSIGHRLMAMALAGGAVYAAAVLFVEGDISFLPQDFATLNSRTLVWLEALEVIYAHPLLGVGFFATGDYLVPLFVWAGNAHNAYLEVILATGAIGFFLLLVFLAYCAWLCIKSKSQALIGVLLFVSLESIFNPLLFSPRTPMLILILLVLAASELAPSVTRAPRRGLRLAADRRVPEPAEAARAPNQRLIGIRARMP